MYRRDKVCFWPGSCCCNSNYPTSFSRQFLPRLLYFHTVVTHVLRHGLYGVVVHDDVGAGVAPVVRALPAPVPQQLLHHVRPLGLREAGEVDPGPVEGLGLPQLPEGVRVRGKAGLQKEKSKPNGTF